MMLTLFLLLATNLVTAAAAAQQLARTCQNKTDPHKIGLQDSTLCERVLVLPVLIGFSHFSKICATLQNLMDCQ